MGYTNPCTAFSEYLLKHDLCPKEGIIADGEIHRFHVDRDKPGSRNGWYVLHQGRISAGAFGSWRSGVWGNWCCRNTRNMSRAEQWEYKKQVQVLRQQREEITQQLRSEVAFEAANLWDSAQPANPNHQYLANKNIRPHHLRQTGDLLLVPIIDPKGKIWNLQRITPTGKKWFLAKGLTKACFSVIPGDDSDLILVCEGFSTGATLREMTGCKVICAMSDRNLQSVAYTAGFLSEASVRLCADNDHFKEGNPGLTAARQAARATGVDLTWPPSCGDNCRCTDFNDIANCPKASRGC